MDIATEELRINDKRRQGMFSNSRIISAIEFVLGASIVIGHNVFRIVPNESYFWIESARSFYQALRHDPNLAMAYIGLSCVYSGLDNPKAAKQFFEKAKAFTRQIL